MASERHSSGDGIECCSGHSLEIWSISCFVRLETDRRFCIAENIGHLRRIRSDQLSKRRIVAAPRLEGEQCGFNRRGRRVAQNASEKQLDAFCCLLSYDVIESA